MPRDAATAQVDMAGLDTSIGFVLRLAQVAVFNDLIAALKPFDLRPTDFSVLLLIGANPGISPLPIGEMLRIQKPNLTTIVDALEKRGFVRREIAPQDRRSYALSLTPCGAKMLAKARKVHQRHARKVAAAVAPADETKVLEALLRIADI